MPTMSTSLFAYPHSLSYHANTLTCVLFTTIVDKLSTIQLLGSLTKSEETNGRSSYPKIPFSSFSLAVLNRLLICSILVYDFISKTQSVRELFKIGTLTAWPFNFPFN